MAITRSGTELRRCSDLTLIRSAIEHEFPECQCERIGLTEIAELCRRHAVSHPGSDWNERRDLILMIGVEWNLARDTLDAQSDACLKSVARLLRYGVS